MVLYPFVPLTFAFIIAQVLHVEVCQVAVDQPKLLFGKVHQSVSIPCHATVLSCTSGSPTLKRLWYVFKKDSHFQLDTDGQPLKYRLEDYHLSVSSLSADDNGVYYCAVTLNDTLNSPNRGMQAFGSGTTVTVKERSFTTGLLLLLLLAVLLLLYSLTILSLIVCIKTRGSTLFLQRRLRTSQIKNTSTRRVHFRAVVQELYKKKNLRSGRGTSINEASSENKFESLQCRAERESIYQNLNKTG
ncbi:uncharacterized protein LOC143508631 [Brachyhypopomus gauderio]|uniref:uncharacterized protein LOC143508631 n=1 Tax=Brachyhypopomus gauderio TaxID=698409 RepID=UPI0040418D42